MNQHNLGDLVRTSAVFSNQTTGLAMDPTVVKLSVCTPDGVVVTYVYGTDAIVVKDSTGHYHADLDANQDGLWYYRWWSTGTGQAADELEFEVLPAVAA